MGDQEPRGRGGGASWRHKSAPVLASFADGGCSHIRPGLGRPLSPRLRSISISVFSPGALDLRHRREAAGIHLAAHTLPTSCEVLPLTPTPRSWQPSLSLPHSCLLHRPCPITLRDLCHLSPLLPPPSHCLYSRTTAASPCLLFTPANYAWLPVSLPAQPPAAHGAQRSPVLMHLCNLSLTFEQGCVFQLPTVHSTAWDPHTACLSSATALPSARAATLEQERMRGDGEKEERGEREAGPGQALTEQAGSAHT